MAMTLGNMRANSVCGLAMAVIHVVATVLGTTSGYAQNRMITCAGLMIDVGLRPKAWALAVIYDAEGGYTCTIDRAGAGHDPMRPCSAGKKCKLTGIYKHKIDTGYSTTYLIDRIMSLDTVEK